MSEKQSISLRKHRRAPKPGVFFGILRILGILFEVGGLLTMAGSLVGFIALLIKLGPDLASALAYSSEQSMAGFVLILLLTWLAVPLITGFFGLLATVIGFICYRLATRPEPVATP